MKWYAMPAFLLFPEGNIILEISTIQIILHKWNHILVG